MVSAPAGIPYLRASKLSTIATSVDADATEQRICVRAGLGLSVPRMACLQMTAEHGLFGCGAKRRG